MKKLKNWLNKGDKSDILLKPLLILIFSNRNEYWSSN